MLNQIIDLDRIQPNGATHAKFAPPNTSNPCVPSVPSVLSTLDIPSAPNLEPETLNLKPSRNGKIARLPHPIREQVNRLLRNGNTYSNIISDLATMGYPGISL